LIAARGALEKGRIPLSIGLWGVHALFLMIALGVFYWESFCLWLARRRSSRSLVHG